MLNLLFCLHSVKTEALDLLVAALMVLQLLEIGDQA